MKLNLKVIKIAIILLLIGIGIVSLVSFFRRNTISLPQVVNSTPANGAVNVGIHTQPIVIFDRPTSAGDIQVSSSPELGWQIVQKDPSAIGLVHQVGFQPKTAYIIQLKWKGELLPPYTLSTELTQEDPQLLDDMKKELERDYPLGQRTPYETGAYRVVYSAPLTLEITLMTQFLSENEAIDQIKTWVKQNGGDPEKHKYTVLKPSSSVDSTSPEPVLPTSPLPPEER